MLRNSKAQWVEDKEELKQMATKFYDRLFSSSPEVEGDLIRGHFFGLDEEQCLGLEKKVAISETKKALNEMGSWKAPGPDGYQLGFF